MHIDLNALGQTILVHKRSWERKGWVIEKIEVPSNFLREIELAIFESRPGENYYKFNKNTWFGISVYRTAKAKPGSKEATVYLEKYDENFPFSDCAFPSKREGRDSKIQTINLSGVYKSGSPSCDKGKLSTSPDMVRGEVDQYQICNKCKHNPDVFDTVCIKYYSKECLLVEAGLCDMPF